ncbi:hypothetical protein VN97_g10433 [Penicillium thymicola]|uniref:Uncharacterized protein n=1 Tax=Penicillium thymicola TaxID=293382 RepID=A0AAI9X4D9_PENTH|nr:hypothetical protein VN97_g10433 [Penicillium thymicola]
MRRLISVLSVFFFPLSFSYPKEVHVFIESRALWQPAFDSSCHISNTVLWSTFLLVGCGAFDLRPVIYT